MRSCCLGHNEITQKLYQSLSIAHLAVRTGTFPGKQKRQWIAQGASGAAAFVLRAVRSGAAPFCVWVVRSRGICDYFPPALLSQAYRAGRRALARLSPGLHTSRIQNVKSEARAEGRDVSTEFRESDLTLPVEAIAVIG